MNNPDTFLVIIRAAATTPESYLGCVMVSLQWREVAVAAFNGAAKWTLGNPLNILVRKLLEYKWTLKQRLILASLLCMRGANMVTLRLLSGIYDYSRTSVLLGSSPLPPQKVVEYFNSVLLLYSRSECGANTGYSFFTS